MPKTAYELEREAKIARNRALIEQLDLKNAAASVTGPTTKTKTSAKPKPPPKPKAKPVQPIKREKRTVDDTPRRVSARLRKSTTIDPDETPARKRKREQEEEAQRRREEEERLAAEELARETKKPRHGELDLETLLGEEWESGALAGLNSRLQAVLQERHPRRTADQDAFVFEKDKNEAVEVAALRERLQDMKIVARAKVTQDRIYSAAYHPDPTMDLIFFGDKHGQLGIWDPRAPVDDAGEEDNVVNSEQRESGKYWRLQVHWPATSRSSISCIKFDPIDAHNVYTSAYDCTVRSLSFTSGISREVFAVEKVLITSMDIPPASHELWLSDAEGWLTHLDLREDKSKRRTYQLSEQKIGCVSVNPINPAFILTSSNNRTLKVWDVRKLEKLSVQRNGVLEFELQDVEQLDKSFFRVGTTTLRAECRHDKSVTSAYWDPRGRSIVSTCYDDALRIWDVSPSLMTKDGPFPSFRPLARIRHNCQTGKWVSLFKAQWSQNPDVYPHFTVGNMDHSLDIFGCKGDRLAKLSDRTKLTAAQAVTCSHPSVVERVATGNASGRCVLWAPADPDDAE
ncbi:WD40 repeat-like protein [Russula ochroleuca]|uniref:DNA damage-binding protein CMR1 n=1 Tax=Russula ochroleuca TaxID=152965 RepID=A0A9P5T822_9AGAM|nr:WD40 repeat-like protein [Russula ochroleuca]